MGVQNIKRFNKKLAPLTVNPKRPQWAFKVLLIGDEGVGKTKLMKSISDAVLVDHYRQKLGSSFGALRLFSEALGVHIQIWNITDKPSFYNLRREFYRGGAGAIYVFSVTNKDSFTHIFDWIEDVVRIVGTTPAVLVGTKLEKGKRRQVKQNDAKALAKRYKISYIETSLQKGSALVKMINGLVGDILKMD